MATTKPPTTSTPAKFTFYVSPGGSDSSDGSSPDTPWATLPHAVAEVRRLRGFNPPAEDTAALLLLPGTFYLGETLSLTSGHLAYLTIRPYSDAGPVIVSGGRPLDLAWTTEGKVRTGTFAGSCSEVFLDTWRLLPARSPNTPWGPNMTAAQGPWHTITDLLQEGTDCKRISNKFKQNCPASNKNGFVLDGEISAEWPDLGQTKVMVFHSWIAEYVRVKEVKEVGGRQEVRFQTPLSHAPVGQWNKAGNWRFLVINNRAVLDQEGEVVCTEAGAEATVSYIPPVDLQEATPIIAALEVLIDIGRTSSISLTGLHFQHTSSGDRDGYPWGTQVSHTIPE